MQVGLAPILRSARRTKAHHTFGTAIRSPAVSGFLPGFNSANNAGEVWNLSPSSSSGVSTPSPFIPAFSWMLSGAGGIGLSRPLG